VEESNNVDTADGVVDALETEGERIEFAGLLAEALWETPWKRETA
jgi:hypothetical protein